MEENEAGSILVDGADETRRSSLASKAGNNKKSKIYFGKDANESAEEEIEIPDISNDTKQQNPEKQEIAKKQPISEQTYSNEPEFFPDIEIDDPSVEQIENVPKIDVSQKNQKKKISPELAEFLSDMPFGLGDDLSSRTKEKEPVCEKTPRPEIPSTRSKKSISGTSAAQQVNGETYGSSRSNCSVESSKGGDDFDDDFLEEKKEEKEKKSPPFKQKTAKKIIHPKPKTALEEALSAFSGPSPFSWNKTPQETKPKPKPTIKKTTTSSLSPRQTTSKNEKEAKQVVEEEPKSIPVSPKPQPVKQVDENKPKITVKPKVQENEKKEKDLSMYYPSSTNSVSEEATLQQSNDPMTFVTSVSDDKTFTAANVQESDDEIEKNIERMRQKYLAEERQQSKSSKSNRSTQKPKRMTAAMMSFMGAPPIPVTKQIDLTKYDGFDPTFDIESSISNVPQLLLEYMDDKYTRESLVFHAVCGSTLPDVTKDSIISRVVVEMKRIMNDTVKLGYITETAYVENQISVLKEAHKKKKEGKNEEELKNRVEKAETQLDDLEVIKDAKIKQIDAEEMSVMMEFEAKFQDEENELDDKWNSEEMQSKFNKPSPKLIELRQEAKVNLKAHRFQEAVLIANEIAALEEMETNEASRRMADAYKNAVQRFEKKYNEEKEQIASNFELKRQRVELENEQQKRPLLQRIEKLNTQISIIEREKELAQRKQIRENALIGTQSPVANSMSTKKKNIPQCGPIALDGKLKLPPLPAFQRPRTKSSLQ